MRTRLWASVCIALLVLAGCASPPIKDKATVVMLDKTPRPVTSQVELLRQRPAASFQVIGMITLEADAAIEGEVTAAFLDIAKEHGADALVFVAGGQISMYGSGNHIVMATAPGFTNSFADSFNKGQADSAKAEALRKNAGLTFFKAEMLVYRKQGIQPASNAGSMPAGSSAATKALLAPYLPN